MEEKGRERFRDSIGTITEEGKRSWIYPKKPSGKFYTYRKWVSYILLAFLVTAPFVKVGGNQLLLFNVLERKFNIFGFPFWPQDFYLFVLSMIIGVIFVALFTVAFGRIFCGWICPQTIFMEMVFRQIEFWIEGDRGRQMRLARMPWNYEKIRKKLLKWFVFFIISFLIANVFLAYIIGSDKLLTYITEGPAQHRSTLFGLVIFTALFYFVFAWFREQVCIIACPYGRLQGVLLDNRSIVVAYDSKRGEGEKGRKKWRNGEDRHAMGHGDCIDCMQCVHVCPTGIDIRNGTQLECVNCTACIDECDHIMESVDLPKGLIRYASQEEIDHKKPFRVTRRMKGYAGVLVILIGTLIGLLFLRADLEASVLRLPGQTFEHKGENISNVYTYKLINKTTRNIQDVTFKLANYKGHITIVGADRINVPAQGLTEGSLFIEIPENLLKEDRIRLKLELYRGDTLIETTKTSFLGPRKFK